MKLLLINPFFKGDTKRYSYQISVPPLSLGFIGTFIRNQWDGEVEIVDPIPQKLNKNQVLKRAEEADFVGLTCYTYNRHLCFDFGKKIKETNPYCKLIVGGVHVNDLDEKILQYYPYVDIVCRGEGEETMLEIVKGRSYSDILGITWRSNGTIVRNPNRPLIPNIDNLYCDFSLLPDFDKYMPDLEIPESMRSARTAHLVTSRGCPFNCSFCGSKRWERVYRAMNPKKIVEQIKHLVDEYGIDYVKFHDDLFTSNKQTILEFCRLLKKNKIDIKFRVLSRVDSVSKEAFTALKEAGCVAIGMGIESGSDHVLLKLNKRATPEKVMKAVKILDELDYWKVGFFMISMPGENKEDYLKSLKLSEKFEQCYYNPLVIFPGTPLYTELKQNGEIDDDFWFDKASPAEVYYCKENFPSAEFSLKEVFQFADYSVKYHTFHYPKSIIKKYGLSKGLLYFLNTAINIPLNGKVSEAYTYLKYNYIYKYKYD